MPLLDLVDQGKQRKYNCKKGLMHALNFSNLKRHNFSCG